jgi:AraC-like DNA-binding protein
VEPPVTYDSVVSATRLIVRLLAHLQSTDSSSWPEHIQQFLQQLHKSAEDDRNALLAVVSGAAEELRGLPLADVLRYAEAELIDRSSNKGRVVPSARVRRMVTLIEERYGHRLTVGELARAVSRDRGHVSSVFRREMGDTVHGYLTRVRMRHAADLVGRGEKIEAVMLMVGYHSKKSFYRQFRSHFGVTPGAFRLCCGALAQSRDV